MRSIKYMFLKKKNISAGWRRQTVHMDSHETELKPPHKVSVFVLLIKREKDTSMPITEDKFDILLSSALASMKVHNRNMLGIMCYG